MSSIPVSQQRPSPWSPLPSLPQVLLGLVGGCLLFFFLLVATILTYDIYYAGRIFPGISMAGVDLAGRSPLEAAHLLKERLPYPERGRIAFQDGTQVWIASPSELGLDFDAQSSALAAFSLGRQGNPLVRAVDQAGAWYYGKDLAPHLVYDERLAQRYLENLAAHVQRPTVEASLNIQGTEVVVNPGQVGRALDVPATLVALGKQFNGLTDGTIPLVIHETQPVILDAARQAAQARQILSTPLILQLPAVAAGAGGPWSFDAGQLAPMLKIERVDSGTTASYQVGLDAESLRLFLEELAPKVEQRAQDARFTFNDQTRQLEPLQKAEIGRSLQIDESLQAIQNGLLQGQHTIDLVVALQQPQVTDDVTAEKLGITDLVSEQTTYFYGSSGSRLQNIQTAAARFHGVLVPPGAVFSMADILGDVSLDTGYAEALIIYGNRTIKGVGGGVCQVSTTLFRTVFFGGYPVIERNPHAYRVSYYEMNAAAQVNTQMAGLDAAVFTPVVDFKFKNDSLAWLLMETYVNIKARTLTWKFYSAPTGRSVEWQTSGLQNIVEPEEPVYQENSELSQGEINQIDWAVEGADVTISRSVLQNGTLLFNDTFNTHYLPWRAVYEYGPGTNLNKLKKRGGRN